MKLNEVRLHCIAEDVDKKHVRIQKFSLGGLGPVVKLFTYWTQLVLKV